MALSYNFSKFFGSNMSKNTTCVMATSIFYLLWTQTFVVVWVLSLLGEILRLNLTVDH